MSSSFIETSRSKTLVRKSDASVLVQNRRQEKGKLDFVNEIWAEIRNAKKSNPHLLTQGIKLTSILSLTRYYLLASTE